MKNPLRAVFDALEPVFENNRFLRPFRTLFDAADTFHFSPGLINTRAPFVRDAVDLKRFMITVIMALSPVILASLLFFGPYVLAMIVVSYMCGGIVEVIFAIVRKHEINEGFLVSGMLLPLILPVSTPLWVVGLGMAFGVLFGKEVFGGTGYNPLNPALVGRCFIFLAWPKHTAPTEWVEPFAWFQQVSWTVWLHPMVYLEPWAWLKIDPLSVQQILAQPMDWIFGAYHAAMPTEAINAVTSATPLAISHTGAMTNMPETWKLFLGNVPGCNGETSALLIALGGCYLMFTKVSNWRCTVSLLVGAAIMGTFLHLLMPKSTVPAYIGLMDGGLMFCAVFMITDPVSGPVTNPARFVYGFLAGVLIVVGRQFGPFPGWITFAVLLMNLFAPLLDEGVWAWRFRRLKQCRIQ